MPTLVSTAGDIHPVWWPDGRELYYLSPAGEMKAAPITVSGTALQPGALVYGAWDGRPQREGRPEVYLRVSGSRRSRDPS